jgi:hypothetical protein
MRLKQFYHICDNSWPEKNGCILWKGTGKCKSWATGSWGYLRIHERENKPFRVTRLVLERKLGRPIRDKHFACHHCDNPQCINPSHIYEGTAWTNAGDRMIRKR